MPPRTSSAAPKASRTPCDLRDGHDPAAASRLLIEQVSAVEHAFVCGVPVAAGGGETRMAAGLGRPLILTTLEPAAAMRILARAHRGRVIAAAALLAAGTGALLIAPLIVLLG